MHAEDGKDGTALINILNLIRCGSKISRHFSGIINKFRRTTSPLSISISSMRNWIVRRFRAAYTSTRTEIFDDRYPPRTVECREENVVYGFDALLLFFFAFLRFLISWWFAALNHNRCLTFAIIIKQISASAACVRPCVLVCSLFFEYQCYTFTSFDWSRFCFIVSSENMNGTVLPPPDSFDCFSIAFIYF